VVILWRVDSSWPLQASDEKNSADKMMRTPLSKQRNKHIQRVLVEAAKLAQTGS
jgi:hypothetical protein